MPIEADALERVGIQRIHDSPKVIAAVARDDWHRCGMCGLRLSLEEVSVDILLAVFDKADVLATILLKVDRGPHPDYIGAQPSLQLRNPGRVGREETRYMLWSFARALLQQLHSAVGGQNVPSRAAPKSRRRCKQ